MDILGGRKYQGRSAAQLAKATITINLNEYQKRKRNEATMGLTPTLGCCSLLPCGACAVRGFENNLPVHVNRLYSLGYDRRALLKLELAEKIRYIGSHYFVRTTCTCGLPLDEEAYAGWRVNYPACQVCAGARL